MKQRILYLLILVSMNISAQTGGGGIVGVVIDYSDEEPLVGATVFVEELKKGIVTNERGEFAFPDLPTANYTLTVRLMGYETQPCKVKAGKGKREKTIIRMKAQSQSLEEVIVMGKSEARKIREQAMPVSVISMSQLQGTVSGVQEILAKTVGVTIRASGGVGSTSRLSVRGLEGKRIGFFLDETSLNDQSDFLDINDIPIDMIDRIEIYKGVVPAKFGGSSMGGAVNLVIKDYPDHYADVSYTHESFNVNKAQTVCKRNMKDAGLVLGIGGSYTYADNSAEPAYGIIRDNIYYLPLDQIGSNWMPYEDYRQADVALINTKTDQVISIISEKKSGLCFPTRPFLKDMIFTTEQNDIYIFTDGHSLAIEYHNGEVLFAAYGVDASGVFAYNPTTKKVRQALLSKGNIGFLHFFL